MGENIAFALLAFTSYFSIVNPLSTMPVFMTMTSELDRKAQRATAKKAVIAAFLTMLAFALSGQLLFSFFGISANAFRIVGGIIFFQMGSDMLQARLGRVKVREEEVKSYVTDISITPLAIPLICGPGAITNSIILMQDADNLTQKGILIGVMATILFITYLVLHASSTLSKMLGETGNKIMLRLMGLIVMVIAVEFFLSGLKPILADIFPTLTTPGGVASIL
ncbi:MAG: NAAT family transporter [Flavobacteriaceae bacterium]|nr:NAAT family transporter [Flavobacteriaceae bacterium]